MIILYLYDWKCAFGHVFSEIRKHRKKCYSSLPFFPQRTTVASLWHPNVAVLTISEFSIIWRWNDSCRNKWSHLTSSAPFHTCTDGHLLYYLNSNNEAFQIFWQATARSPQHGTAISPSPVFTQSQSLRHALCWQDKCEQENVCLWKFIVLCFAYIIKGTAKLQKHFPSCNT